ncbi:alpha/beta hydrolase [Brevibacillus humidisoli]|uniref:alpha/beta hydrolase n=1 Tax=Brevibacillus humidisoli TaxID=2895522 RepID=UPI001E3E2255|nr:alpha/beta hydrolase [Brevibacillus humidisoli]UFJ41861.1 alpha/beta hydrolase [Brevibacillus humidisoli]
MKLFRRNWPISEAKGSVVLVHGTAEHSGRYEHVAAYINRCGYAVYAGDLPGWGRSPGLKGHVDTFQDYLETVRDWLDTARAEADAADIPLYLMGHSLGGLIAVRLLQQLQRQDQLKVNGLILSSPCLKLRLAVPAWKARIAGGLNQLWPKLRMSNQIAPWQVTRDETVRRQYRVDPMVYNKVSVRWYCELQEAMKAAMAEADKVTVPLLVLQAGDDQLVDPEAVALFVKQAKATDKTFQLYSGLYHEVLNEPERDQVLTAIGEWLQGHENSIRQM